MSAVESFVTSPIAPGASEPGAAIVSPPGVEARNGQVFQESPLEQDPKIIISQKLTVTIDDNSSAILSYREEYRGAIGSIAIGLQEQNAGMTERSALKEARSIVRLGIPKRKKEQSGIIVDFRSGVPVGSQSSEISQIPEPLSSDVHKLVHNAISANKASRAARYRAGKLKQWEEYFAGTAQVSPAGVNNPARSRNLYKRKLNQVEIQIQASEIRRHLPESERADLIRKRDYYSLVLNLIHAVESDRTSQNQAEEKSGVDLTGDKAELVVAAETEKPDEERLGEVRAELAEGRNGQSDSDTTDGMVVDGEVISVVEFRLPGRTREQLLNENGQLSAALRAAQARIELLEGELGGLVQMSNGVVNGGGLNGRIARSGQNIPISQTRIRDLNKSTIS